MCIAIIRAKYRDNTRHDFDAANEAALEKRVEELGANELCTEIRIFRTEGKLVRRSEMVFRKDSDHAAEAAP